jgi:glycosyltransferase involved in cell wall biosynthesis
MSSQDTSKTVSIVAPFYNEELVVDKFFSRIIPILEGLEIQYEIICVNDGSTDSTLTSLIKYSNLNYHIKVVELSRNFGKEAALTAALDFASGDAVIPIDSDLQDPPELIPRMIDLWKNGAEVVLARRSDRSSDSWIKRTAATLFYSVHNEISDFSIPKDVGDFRLMDRFVVDVVRSLPESRRFMKGIFSWVGFKSITIDYVREQRIAGSSKFNGWKLWNFALEGITSFSTAPLKIWFYLGLVVAFLSLFYASIIVVKTFIFGVDVPGYASIITSLLFLGGIQLIGIGVLGEYIGRIYIESKRRPVYIVRKLYSLEHGNVAGQTSAQHHNRLTRGLNC